MTDQRAMGANTVFADALLGIRQHTHVVFEGKLDSVNVVVAAVRDVAV